MLTNSHRFPPGKQFAFTVFDDTDAGTVETVGPVYRLLSELGMRTTKSTWVFPTDPKRIYAGSTLHDRKYLKFLIDLEERGFEIGLHNVQNGDATRETVERGLEDFRNLLGHCPRSHANHMDNRENIYWGPHRISQFKVRAAYELGTRFRYFRYFEGHDPSSRFFWGDLCKEQIAYVRNFVFNDINLDHINPSQPYHDPLKPYVNFWFSSTDGGDVDKFCQAISEANQDRLEAEGGVCVMYTHFASGFCKDGVLNSEFRRLMTRLASKNGWFVPVSTLMDRLLKNRSRADIPRDELHNMERYWLSKRVLTTSKLALHWLHI